MAGGYAFRHQVYYNSALDFTPEKKPMPPTPARPSRKLSPQAARRLLIIAEIILLLGAIALFIALAGPHQTIRCERTDQQVIDCRVTRTLFKWIEYDTIELPAALFASLGEDCEPSGCVYALQVFTADQGFIEIEPYRQYNNHHATLVDLINDFMQDEESPSIEIAYQLNTLNYLIFAVAIALLLGLIAITLWGKR